MPVKLLAPPPEAVRVFQAQFLKCMMPETEGERKCKRSRHKGSARTRTSLVRVVLHGLNAEEMNGRTGLRGPWEKNQVRF